MARPAVELVQSQIDVIELRVRLARMEERIAALDRVTDEKFVRLGVVVAAEAERVRLALAASEKAIDKADIADEKARDRLAEEVQQRFESVNEFRGQQKDMIATLLARAEFEQFRMSHSKELAELKERIDRAEGRTTGSTGTWAAVVAGITLIVIVINVVIYAISNQG